MLIVSRQQNKALRRHEQTSRQARALHYLRGIVELIANTNEDFVLRVSHIIRSLFAKSYVRGSAANLLLMGLTVATSVSPSSAEDPMTGRRTPVPNTPTHRMLPTRSCDGEIPAYKCRQSSCRQKGTNMQKTKSSRCSTSSQVKNSYSCIVGHLRYKRTKKSVRDTEAVHTTPHHTSIHSHLDDDATCRVENPVNLPCFHGPTLTSGLARVWERVRVATSR